MTAVPDLTALRSALRAVQRDLDGDAPTPGRLRLIGTEQGVFVALPDGRFWPAGGGPLPITDQSAAAVVAVAAAVQECLAEILWLAWPRCPEHDAVLRPERASSTDPTDPTDPADPPGPTDPPGPPGPPGPAESAGAARLVGNVGAGEPVWSCADGAGHHVAAVGRLARAGGRGAPAGAAADAAESMPPDGPSPRPDT
jgi:hypothetical protein